MANPPKQKGTAAETELLRKFLEAGFYGERTAPTLPYDLRVDSHPSMAGRKVEVLATRPDRGRWLVTIDLNEFLDLLGYRGYGARIEVKRFKKFAHHSIFEEKFSR